MPTSTSKPHTLNASYRHTRHQPRGNGESLSFLPHILTTLSVQHWSCHFPLWSVICKSTDKNKLQQTTDHRPSPVCTALFFYADRWTHRLSSPTKLHPDSTFLCFHPDTRWASADFFSIFRSLQTAKFPHQRQVELMRMIAQPLNQKWGFNISWKLGKYEF